ncbi:MAG: hypothetical protein AAF664_25715 [Planctomycetota bacterium]
MTQPLLFDLNSNPETTRQASAIPQLEAPMGELIPAEPSVVPITASQSSERVKIEPPVESLGFVGSDEPGLNHMGDLARLVLMRYAGVAARWARRRARAAAAKA